MEPRLPNVLTGADHPALIVPTFGSPEDVSTMAAAAVAGGADVIEWRADLSDQWETCADALAGVSVPILATLRSDSEGGRFPARGHEYTTAVMRLATMGFDILDVEIKRPAAYQAVSAAHDSGIPVIASHHSFDHTPANSEILAILDEMVEARADLLKVAFTPQHDDDTWRQMELSRGLQRRYGLPIISISMGAGAAWTRLAAGACGSAATFASLGDGSAPGQLDIKLVRSVLDALGR